MITEMVNYKIDKKIVKLSRKGLEKMMGIKFNKDDIIIINSVHNPHDTHKNDFVINVRIRSVISEL